jgi:hypothetical protein
MDVMVSGGDVKLIEIATCYRGGCDVVHQIDFYQLHILF